MVLLDSPLPPSRSRVQKSLQFYLLCSFSIRESFIKASVWIVWKLAWFSTQQMHQLSVHLVAFYAANSLKSSNTSSNQVLRLIKASLKSQVSGGQSKSSLHKQFASQFQVSQISESWKLNWHSIWTFSIQSCVSVLYITETKSFQCKGLINNFSRYVAM